MISEAFFLLYAYVSGLKSIFRIKTRVDAFSNNNVTKLAFLTLKWLFSSIFEVVWHASLLGKRLKKAWRVPLVFVLDSRERNRRAINEEQLNQAIKSDLYPYFWVRLGCTWRSRTFFGYDWFFRVLQARRENFVAFAFLA